MQFNILFVCFFFNFTSQYKSNLFEIEVYFDNKMYFPVRILKKTCYTYILFK